MFKQNVLNFFLMEDDVLFNDDMIIIIDYYLYKLGLGGGYLFK